MKSIAVIPARGGSRRLPRKNILAFNGRPIIAWTIQAAVESGCFDKIMVSTEDPEISGIARECSVEVHDRSSDLAGDSARVVDVCLNVLDEEQQRGREYDILCCLYPTAPLRNAADVRAVHDLINPGTCSFSLAVTHYHYPPHQALRIVDTGMVEPLWPELIDIRDDEFDKIVVDNGSTYAAEVSAFRQQRSFYGERLKCVVLPHSRSVDINYREDLEMAEYYSRLDK